MTDVRAVLEKALGQLVISDQYAAEAKKPSDLLVPSVWEIQNAHVRGWVNVALARLRKAETVVPSQPDAFREAVKRVDVRSIARAQLARMRRTGESHETCVRWIAAEVEGAIARLMEESEPRAADLHDWYDRVQTQCAHFGGARPGRCLLDERDWSPGCKPQRCAECPDASRDDPQTLAEALERIEQADTRLSGVYGNEVAHRGYFARIARAALDRKRG